MSTYIDHRRLALAAVFSLALVANAQTSHVGALTGQAANGNDRYKRNCQGCHGAKGDGTGTFAPYLDPRPRDMTAGIYKCRSTPSGSLPTDQDLYNTLKRGILTTAMPSWASLTPQNRTDIVAYVKKFSPRFATEAPGQPILITPEAPLTQAGLQHGKALYTRLECAQCHGNTGTGNGPQAATLLDIKHRPDPPYDFSATDRYKCGSSNTDLYRTLLTGLDGSPMHTYADKLDPAETWDLVHYLRTLQVTRSGPERDLLKSSTSPKPPAANSPHP